jgi:hypothetical protein
MDAEFDFYGINENPFAEQKDNEAKSIVTKSIVTQNKRKAIFLTRKDSITELLPKSIRNSTSLHIISSGSFGSNELLDAINDKYKIQSIIVATWSINNDFIDVIHKIDVPTKLIIDRSIITRKAQYYGRFISINKTCDVVLVRGVHAKLTIIETQENGKLIIEASANYSNNVKIEQFTITQSNELYGFHKSWMNKLSNEK